MSLNMRHLLSFPQRLLVSPSLRFFRTTPLSFAGEAGVANEPPKIKRFWKTVNMEPTDTGDKVRILLDKRVLKTPGGNEIVFPKENLIPAVALALEWENQELVMKAFSLPVTSLYARGIDVFTKEQERVKMVDSLTSFLKTDSITFYEGDNDKFKHFQSLYWTPIIEWVEKTYNVKIKVHTEIFGTSQDPETVQILRDAALEFDPLKFAAFERIVISSKSFLIGLALCKGHITVEEAAAAAQAEVESQIASWGMVEDAHDIEREDIRIRLGSAALYCTHDPSTLLPPSESN